MVNFGQAKTFSSYIFWWIVLLFVSPFFLLFLGLMLFWKFGIVEPLAKLVLSKSARGLDAFDGILAMDSFWEKPLGSLGQLLVLEGKFDVHQFCAYFRKTILEARGANNQLIYQKLMEVPREFCGYVFWEAAQDFRVEDHMRITDSLVTESDLRQYTEDCIKSPFPQGKPLWEVRVLTNYQPAQPCEMPLTVLILKLHHVTADGYTFVKLTDKLMGNVTTDYQPKKETVSLARKLSLAFRAPSDVVHLYWDNMRHRDWFTQKKLSQEFVISWKILPLKLLKSIRKKTGVHFATLGISSLSGALEKYAKLSNAKDQDFARVLLPLPWPGHPSDTMANHWTMGIVKVPFHEEPLTRLGKTEQDLLSVMTSNCPILIRWVGPRMLSVVPSFFLRRLLRSNVGAGIIVTSVPGPSHKELWIEHNRVRTIIPITGTQYSQTGIVEIIHTYNEVATIIIAANTDICPTPASIDVICNYVQEELETLLLDEKNSKEFHSVQIQNSFFSAN